MQGVRRAFLCIETATMRCRRYIQIEVAANVRVLRCTDEVQIEIPLSENIDFLLENFRAERMAA